MLERLAWRIDPAARLGRSWNLDGGVSAALTAFELERADGRVDRLVLRRHGPADLARNPHVAEHELRVLELVRSADVPVPAPCGVYPEGLVVEYVDGAPAPAAADAAVRPLAAVLARIHGVGAELDVAFLPRRELVAPAAGARSHAVLATATPRARNPDVLLHGDFWPGNTLWREETVVAVVDWEDAAIGDPLADVANARLELLWAYGPEAMADFTRLYTATGIDLADLPLWDLAADARLAGRIDEWGLDAATVARLRRGHEWFVADALERLRRRSGARAAQR